MAIVQIHNLPKPVAIGLDWNLLPGNTSERKELDTLAKETGCKFGCVLSNDTDGTTIVGLSTDRKDKVLCGGGWLARAAGSEPLVLVEPLPDGRIWLCAVRAGAPVTGMDVVIDASNLHEKLNEFLRDGTAKLCSTLDNLDSVYNNVVPQSFAELVANTPEMRVTRISGVNPTYAIAAGVAVLAIGGWYGADIYMTQMRQQEARAKLAQINAEQQKQTAVDAERARRARVEEAKALVSRVVIEKPSVKDQLDAFFAEMESKPLALAGWQLIGYDCNASNCSLVWRRGHMGTIATFLAAAELKGWSTQSAEGSDAVTTHAISVEQRKDTIDSLSEEQAFRAALETRLQEAGAATGIRYDLTKPVGIEVVMAKLKGDAPLPGAGELKPEPLPWKVGTLTVKGTRLFELRDLPDYIAHAGLSIKSVRGDLKTNEWTMELDYATR